MGNVYISIDELKQNIQNIRVTKEDEFDRQFTQINNKLAELINNSPQDSMLAKVAQSFPEIERQFRLFGDEMINEAENLANGTGFVEGKVEEAIAQTGRYGGGA